ncbi:amidase [Pseudomonas sp. RIT-PI-q]|uniref:amidase n=1 Tax=Pseudomonas sp. RIT-PI-q TaxID=1690247 RepID=UPI0006CCCC93|nr:amidase [Pseudomonas sp. RIT-PI-q]KPG96030.1 amidase [Pseudomonas sp. RIT-PI-q]
MSDLHYISATDALAAFKARTLSPVELMDAVIARAAEVEPTINAFYETHYEEARESAKAAEVRYAKNSNELPLPLDGLPTAVKGEEPVSNQGWTLGSLYMKDEVAQFTAPWIERLQGAGAIVHARTTLPEFAMSYFCHSKIDGVTRNPWNTDYTPGGSSGGAGASLAAGTTTLATGSDVAGSIRVPASFCGLVGFKPPYGRVPMWAPFNLDVYCHVGPMTRTVADAVLMQNIAAGPHVADAVSLRPKYVLPEHLEDVRGLRLAVSIDFGGSWPVDEEIRKNTLAAAAALRSAGAIVEEVDLVIEREDVKRASAIHFAPFMSWVQEHSAGRESDASEYLLHAAQVLIGRAKGATALEGTELEAKISGTINQVLERYDALLCPTLGSRGFIAGDDYIDHGVEVNGEVVDFYWDSSLTIPFNIMSRCPVLNVPTGLARNGVPTGMQIVGRTYDDVTTFRIGAALERINPWFDVAARRPKI